MKIPYNMLLIKLMVVYILYFYGCTMNTYTPDNRTAGYNFSRPDQTLVLPDTLHEISGLTVIDDNRCACIQDENGILFIYNLTENEIEKQAFFGDNGDYEGIAKVGETVFVLRSEGTLFEIPGYTSENPKVTSYFTGVPAEDSEGLCFDPEKNRLLIASKGKAGKGKEKKDQRLIFGFDLQSKTLEAMPAFSFDIETIRDYAQMNKIELPTKIKKNGEISKPVLKFKTSAIAIHPITNKLYLISADDYLLFVFDRTGKIENMVQLDSVLFNKAEGIAFAGNGDLYISNEGQGKNPTILRFNYQK
jgi:uncharacterized protein YjiK